MSSEMKNKITFWIQQAFKDFDKITVEFPEEDTTGGYAAEMVYADVEASKGNEIKIYNILVKKNKDNDLLMDKMNFRYIYEKEVFIYSTYLPYLKNFAKKRDASPFVNIPHCYGTVNEKNHCIILMENLKPKNYRCHPLGGESMTMDHLKLVIEAYAKWHAFGLAVADQDPDILKNFSTPKHLLDNSFLMEPICAAVENEIEFVSKIYEEKNETDMLDVLQKLKKNYRKLFRDMLENKNEDYLVPRHGDSWNNNFLFHINEDTNVPDDAIIIDWQGGILGSPVADVHQFLFYCCSSKELVHLDEILKFYYDTLSKKVKELGSDPEKCFPWQACRKSFEQYVAVSLAAVPLCGRLCFKGETKKDFEFADAIKDGNLKDLFGDELIDPKKYFERIDGILKLAKERKLV